MSEYFGIKDYLAQNGHSLFSLWCLTHFSQSLWRSQSSLGHGQFGADITKNYASSIIFFIVFTAKEAPDTFLKRSSLPAINL